MFVPPLGHLDSLINFGASLRRGSMKGGWREGGGGISGGGKINNQIIKRIQLFEFLIFLFIFCFLSPAITGIEI